MSCWSDARLSVPIPSRNEGGGWREEKPMTVQSYRQLEVWQLGMELAEMCYQVAKSFPREELFGMTSQIRRAAASIPANIAEGQGRDHTKEFLNHLSIARGSLMELETHLMLSQRVGLLPKADLEKLLVLTDRISRMLTGLRKALQQKRHSSTISIGSLFGLMPPAVPDKRPPPRGPVPPATPARRLLPLRASGTLPFPALTTPAPRTAPATAADATYDNTTDC
jgi:four helix bundle protein